jgi:hypothetical protein
MTNRGRHEHGCRICSNPKREEIERDWLDWGNTTRIAKDHKLSRDSIYRHAHALNLFAKRDGNLRRALYRMIERAEDVEPTAAAVVAAVQAAAKINAAGKWVERVEQITVQDLFDRMSDPELEAYARDGSLPKWFPKDATGLDGPEN